MLSLKKHPLYPGEYTIARKGSDPEIMRIVGAAKKTLPMPADGRDVRTAYDLYLRGATDYRNVHVEHFAGTLAELRTWLKGQHYGLVDGKPTFVPDADAARR